MAHRTSSVVNDPADGTRLRDDEDAAQRRLCTAYAVVYSLHSRATQLVTEAIELFAQVYAPVTPSTVASSFSPIQGEAKQREEIAGLLLRCTDMQTKLTVSSSDHLERGADADEEVGNNGADAAHAAAAAMEKEVGEKEAHQAILLLYCSLPLDWQEATSLLNTRPRATQRADRSKQHSYPSASASSHAHTAAIITSSSSTTAASQAPEAISFPPDVVQLALLLRRHWALQRDLALTLNALLDLSLAGEDEAICAGRNVTGETSPPLSVVVALALLQLSHAQDLFEAHTPSQEASALMYTPTSQHEAQSLARPPLSTAMTVLPQLLWRACVLAEGSNKESNAHKKILNATTTTAATVAHGCATARQLTKLMYKWEAHIAAYTSAQLSSLASAQGGDSGRSVLMTEKDVSFLSSVVAELNVLHGACNATQLLWLSIHASLHPLPNAPATGPSHALAGVAKRCAKIEKTLRPLLTTTATARLVLPGVLLWLGYPACAASPVYTSDQQQQQRHEAILHWQEAYHLGQQVLGDAHPFVREVASLLTRAASASPPTPNRQRLKGKGENGPRSAEPEKDKDEAQEQHNTVAASRPPRALPPCSPTQLPVRSAPPPPPPPSHSVPSSATLPQAILPPVPPQPRTSTAPAQRLHPSPPPSRTPDATRAFATAFSPQRQPPLVDHMPGRQTTPAPPRTLRPVEESTARKSGGGGGVGGDQDGVAALHRTFPPPPSSLSTVPAITGPSPPAAPVPPLRPAGKTRVKGLAALRNCHRLGNPADAFALASTVHDAVFDDDLAHKAAMARRHGRRKKKGKGQKDTVASTEALLLSAAAEDSITSVDDASVASNAGSSKRRQRRPRRRRPDRLLLPVLAEVRRCADEGDANTSLLPPDPLSPFTDGADPLWNTSVCDDAPTAESGVTHKDAFKSAHESLSSYAARAGKAGEAGSASADEEEEDDEEDYDKETLPERNARMQREIRTYYIQLNARRVHAAAVIQRAWRCSQARQILQVRQQMLYRYVFIIQKAAALAIEGFVLSVWEQRRRRTALARRTEENAQRMVLERRQLAAAQILTRAGRQWLQRQRERRRLREQLNLERDARLRLYEITSVVVQRWWRNVLPQKLYWRKRTAEVEAQRQRQAEADRLARAATAIQKRVRGVQARSRVEALKRTRAAEALALRVRRDAAVTVLTIVLQEHVRRQAREAREAAERQEREEDAVLCIAQSWRSTLERRRLDVAVQRARQLRIAATRMQRAWRRYIAGRQRRYLRQARRSLQDERLAREHRLCTSVVLVQCAVRGAMDQLLVRALKARVGRSFMESLVLIQSILRGGQVRAELGQARLVEHARQRAEAAAAAHHREEALRLLQGVLRARKSAFAAQQLRRTRLAEKLRVYSAAACEMREDAAAAVVQRAVRHHQHRQRTAAASAEAAAALRYLCGKARCIQQAWRAHAARRERHQRAGAAARCAQKRQEREEVMELVWRDQKRELDVLYTLEQHYIAEAEHAARVALYRAWMRPSSSSSVGATVSPQAARADAMDSWAALYVE